MKDSDLARSRKLHEEQEREAFLEEEFRRREPKVIS